MIKTTDGIRANYEEFGFSSFLHDQFVEEFEPDFDVQMSERYTYGDHPDTGGGVVLRDIEAVILIEAGGKDRNWWVNRLGEAFVEQIEDEHGDRL